MRTRNGPEPTGHRRPPVRPDRDPGATVVAGGRRDRYGPAVAVTAVVEHRSEYRFDPPVHLAPHIVRLRPADHAPGVRSWHLAVEDAPARTTWRAHEGWWRGRLQVRGRTAGLTLAAATTVAHRPLDPERRPPGAVDASPGAVGPPPVGAVRALAADLDLSAAPDDPGAAVAVLVEATGRVASAVAHEERHDPIERTPSEVVALGRGSCRDAAAVLAEVVRALGAPARIVTGLLVRLAGEADLAGRWAGGAVADQDASSLHAWVEAWVPATGWVGLDPTSGRPAGAGHLALATDPRRAPVPVVGSTGPCRAHLAVTHRVRRVDAAAGAAVR